MTGRRAVSIVTPLLFGIVLVLAWELFVDWRDIKPFLLPKPSAIWSEIVDNQNEIWNAARETGTNALVGLFAGTVVGVAVALVASRFKIASELLTPLAAAVNAIPIIALAPLFNNMFSSTSAIFNPSA